MSTAIDRKPEPLLSASEMARIVGVAEATLASRIERGLLVEDFVLNGSGLRPPQRMFRVDSLDRVKTAIFTKLPPNY
jgi:hypothetical protein